MLVEFSIFKNGRTGRYYAQYRDTSGIRRQFSCRTKVKSRAEKFARHKLELSEVHESSRLTLLELSTYLTESVLRHHSQGTIREYRGSFNQLVKRIGNIKVSRLTPTICNNFVYQNQPSAHTAARHLRQLRRCFSVARSLKLISVNPFEHVANPIIVERKKDYLTQADFVRLSRSLPTSTFSERRFKRMIILGRLTGMRLNELLNLGESSIDRSLLVIRVTNQSSFRTKSKRIRAVPISNEAGKLIENQLKDNHSSKSQQVKDCNLLFPNLSGGVLSKSNVSRQFKMIARRVFPEKTNLCFHSLRSTFITLAYHDNVPPQQIQIAVGHSTIRTTEGYAHFNGMPMAELKASLDKVTMNTV